MIDLPDIRCDYCLQKASLVRGSEIYGAAHKDRYFWKCDPCSAWVGVHPNSNYRPTGRFANKALRECRCQAHGVLHKLIDLLAEKNNISPEHARSRAYQILANKLMIERHECHIQKFTLDMCQQFIDMCGFVLKKEAGGSNA